MSQIFGVTMRETTGEDIFNKIDTACAISIPTNCTLMQNGENPMGALAGAAAARWPEVPKAYGRLLSLSPNVPVVIGYISKKNQDQFTSSLSSLEGISSRTHTALVALPTMVQITEPASLKLVKRSAKLLVEMADLFYWINVYTGRLGCGVGGLIYEGQVRPMLASIFDERFCVMHK